MTADFFQQFQRLAGVGFGQTGLFAEFLVLLEGEHAIRGHAVEHFVEDLRVESSVENPHVAPKTFTHL